MGDRPSDGRLSLVVIGKPERALVSCVLHVVLGITMILGMVETQQCSWGLDPPISAYVSRLNPGAYPYTYYR